MAATPAVDPIFAAIAEYWGALRNSLIAHDAQWIFAPQLPVLPAKERPPIGAGSIAASTPQLVHGDADDHPPAPPHGCG